MLVTFSLTVFAWIFFRAENIKHALNYISVIFSDSLFTVPKFPGMYKALETLFLIAGFVLVEWIGREQQYAIANIGIKWYKPFRWGFYFILSLMTLLFSGSQQEFIYFQF